MSKFQRRLTKRSHTVSKYPLELEQIVIAKEGDADDQHKLLYGVISSLSKFHDTRQIHVGDKSFAVELTEAYIGFKELAEHKERVKDVLGGDCISSPAALQR